MKPAPLTFEPAAGPAVASARRRPLLALWQRFAYVVAFYGCFATMCVLLAIAALPLHVLLPHRLRRRFGRFAIQAILRQLVAFMRKAGLLEIDATDLDKLSNLRGVIIAPNHPSLIDALIVMSRLPDAVCIIKAGLWNNPLLGGVKLAGYVRNDSETAVIRRSVEALREGGQLLIFPEGTRTVRGPLNEFKGGFALMSRLAGAPVQTVFIKTDSPAYRKGWPVFRRPQFPMRFTIRLGRKFTVGPEDDLTKWVAGLEGYYRNELG